MGRTLQTRGVDEQIWLSGVDESMGAHRALEWTAHQARGRSVRIHALAAWQRPWVGHLPLPGGAGTQLAEEAKHSARRSLDGAVASASVRTDAPIESILVEGGATKCLLEASKGSDLLVLGAHGSSGAARLRLGSVSKQCVAHGVIPTIVVPEGTLSEAVDHVVVGVDGSPHSLDALRWALEFSPASARVEAVSAWEDTLILVNDVSMALDGDSRIRLREQFEASVDAVAAEFPQRSVERTFENDDPFTALQRISNTADLVVVGKQGLGGLLGAVVGSVATTLLHTATRPIAVIPPRAS